VEAAYNANMPFKWNATRVQVLPNQRAGPGGPGSGAPPPPKNITSSTTLNSQVFTNAPQGGMGLLQKPPPAPPPPHLNQPPRAFGGHSDFPGPGPRDPFGNPRGMNSGGGGGRLNSPPRNLGSGGLGSSNKGPDKSDRGPNRRAVGSGTPREERRVERSRELSRDKDRSRGSPAPRERKRSRSPVRTHSRSPKRGSQSRSRSPPRRRARTAPRYNVSVPKVSLHFPESNVFDLKHRFSHM
jgi:hypothetical protein